MSNHFDLETFTFNGHTLRTVVIDGKPWFFAVDVCLALGLSRKNVTYYIQVALDRSEIRLILRDADMPESLRHMRGFPTGVNVISESGLYKIVLRAQRKNPAAKDFQDWITQTVIPAIRKTSAAGAAGSYIKDKEKVATGEMSVEEFIAKIPEVRALKGHEAVTNC